MYNKQLLITLGLTFPFISAVANDKDAKEERPNILFCLADDVSYPFWGAYGCDWVRTPNTDKVASHGILFMNTYTCNAKSGPSRSCILTGRNTWQLEAACNHFAFWPSKFKTFAEVLSQAGYFVAQTGKGWAPGDPGMLNGKKRELIGKRYDRIKLTPATPEISNTDYAANFNEFIDTRDKSKPFFFWYGGLEPHRAYEYGSGVAKGGYDTKSIKQIPPYWPDVEETRNDMLDFAFELEHFDDHLGRMLNKLEKEGLLDNTIIVVTADNGMPFPRIKGQAYLSSNHLPMTIWWPKKMKKKGMKNNDFISFTDLAPTFLDIAGVKGEDYGMQPIQGTSFKNILEGKKLKAGDKKDYMLIGKERHDIGRPNDEGYPIRGIITDEYVYVYNFKNDRWPAGNPETGYLNCDGGAIKSFLIKNKNTNDVNSNYWELNFGKRPQEELYMITNDPDCMNNLAKEKKYSKIKNKLKDILFSELKKQKDPRVLGNGDIFDNYPYCDTKYRNYYNRVMNGEKIPTPGWIYPSDVDNSK